MSTVDALDFALNKVYDIRRWHVLRICQRFFTNEFFINKIFWAISTWLLTSTSDLQPSTAIVNQLPGQ